MGSQIDLRDGMTGVRREKGVFVCATCLLWRVMRGMWTFPAVLWFLDTLGYERMSG
jgi:hypothetical protein